MFSKLLSLVVLLPLVASLTVDSLEDAHSQGQVTIRWTASPSDPPTFSIELTNEVFNDTFAVANNVDTSLGELTITLPVVPEGGGYTIQLVDIGNVNNVFAESAGFSIGAVESASLTSTSSTGSSTGTGTSSGQSTSSTTTGFGTTVPSPTSRSTSSTPSDTGTEPAPSPSSFNNDDPDGASTLGLNVVGAGLAAVVAAFLTL